MQLIERRPGVSLEWGEERDFSKMISQKRLSAKSFTARDTKRNDVVHAEELI
jgi:hypothetical protein